MKQFILWNIVLSIVIGLLGPWSSTSGTAIEEPSVEQQRPNQQAYNAGERLEPFARAYVQIHKIIAEYGRSLKGTRNPEHAEKLRKEAISKMAQRLEAQGFTPESFRRTFQFVNADDELRTKAL